LMLPLTTILFLCAYAVGCLGALRYPLFGVVTYLLLYFAYPEMTWWAKPIAWMGQRYSLVAAIFLGAGFLLNWHRGGWGKQFWHRQEILFVVLIGAMWISLFTGVGPSPLGYKHLDKMVKVTIFVLLMTHVVTDIRSYRVVKWSLVIGTLYLGYISFTAGPGSFYLGRLNNIGGPDFDRAPELGVHFAAMLPLIGTMLLAERRWYLMAVLAITAALTCNGLVLTRTRSAMTALIAGMIWAVLQVPRKWRGRLVGLGLVGVVGAYALTDEGFWERMATIPSTIDAESAEHRDPEGTIITYGRIPTWKAAWAMWLDHPLGVGIGNFTRVIGEYAPSMPAIDAHNTVVLCLAELGILGIAVFLAVLVMVLGRLRHLKRSLAGQPSLRWVSLDAFGLEAALVTFLIGGMTVSRFYCEMLWWLLALPICLERAIANALEREAPAAQAAEVGPDGVRPARGLLGSKRPVMPPPGQSQPLLLPGS